MEPYTYYLFGIFTALGVIILYRLIQDSLDDHDSYEVLDEGEEAPPKAEVIIPAVDDHNIMIGDDFYLADGGILHVTNITQIEDNLILKGFYYANSH